MTCEDFCRLAPVHASLDRLQEGHYWLHRMEDTYHEPDQFRFSAYAAIRVLGETFEIVYTECVEHSQDRATFRAIRKKLRSNILAGSVREARNRLTHAGNLTFSNDLSIGNGSPKAMRNSFPARSDINLSTRALCRAQKNVWEDEDFQRIGFRRWFISEIDPQVEIVETLCGHWLSLSNYTIGTLERLDLSVSLPEFSLKCRENPPTDFRICAY